MQQNKTTLVQLPLTTLGQETEVGLFYNAPEPTRGANSLTTVSYFKLSRVVRTLFFRTFSHFVTFIHDRKGKSFRAL